MLNEKQIEIADFLLTYLQKNGGNSTKDDYPAELDKQSYKKLDSVFVLGFLIDLNLIDYWDESKYRIKLKPEGYEAAKIGLSKYLSNLERDKELDRSQKTETTRTAISTRTMSKLGIILTFVFPVLLMVAQNYYQKSNAKPANANYNGSQSHQATDTIVSHLRIDSAFIEVIKDSLKHDREFLNELKFMIQESEQ